MSMSQVEVERLLDILEGKTMSHEDHWTPEEMKKDRERLYNTSPQRETSAETKMTKPTFLTRTEGYITVDVPPITLPTPAKAARWLATSPAMRVLLYVLIGVGIGYFGHYVPPVSNDHPALIVPATETLTDFVARESQALSADERRKLIAITEQILNRNFDTPSALREEFYYQRDKAKLPDSPVFTAFWDKWAAKVTEMKIEESVESMRDVYTQLFHGLQSVKSYIDFSGEPVEGFLHNFSPSIIDNASSTSADEPVTPGFIKTTDGRPQTAGQETRQRQRIFRRVQR